MNIDDTLTGFQQLLEPLGAAKLIFLAGDNYIQIELHGLAACLCLPCADRTLDTLHRTMIVIATRSMVMMTMVVTVIVVTMIVMIVVMVVAVVTARTMHMGLSRFMIMFMFMLMIVVVIVVTAWTVDMGRFGNCRFMIMLAIGTVNMRLLSMGVIMIVVIVFAIRPMHMSRTMFRFFMIMMIVIIMIMFTIRPMNMSGLMFRLMIVIVVAAWPVNMGMFMFISAGRIFHGNI
jgi:hypothetical protein